MANINRFDSPHPFYEQIPLDTGRTYIAREFLVEELTFPFHHHPFFEINYVVQGTGQRIVGQKISDFKNSDLTLVAPNLPHRFKNQEDKPGEKIHSIIVQFHPTILGETFIEKSEMLALKALLKKAKRGITFGENTIAKLDPKFKNLLKLSGFKGILLFLEILYVMAEATDYKYLSEMDWQESVSGKGKELTDRVFQFIFSHFNEEIKLAEVAQIAGISKSAFSHYFKKRTGKTYSEFINELRVSNSTKLLAETEKSISEICFESGFSNLSYFNRVFKSIHSFTPREFRKNHNELFG